VAERFSEADASGWGRQEVIAIPVGDHSGSLEAVQAGIVGCERCRRLRAYCHRIAEQKKPEFRAWSYWGKPVPGFGDPRARVLVVGLAPAAHGGNRTGRVFTGDSSGDWLYQALYRFGFANQPRSVSRDDGLQLRDCYVTAAARCAPPGNRPTARELDRCRPWLAGELALLTHVRIVIGLGRIACDAWLQASGWWDRLPSRERPVFRHCEVTTLLDGTVFIASYHPSRQNTNTGRLTRAMWYRIFREARRALERLKE
jgi:uracil-DNA glycosylase family 4